MIWSGTLSLSRLDGFGWISRPVTRDFVCIFKTAGFRKTLLYTALQSVFPIETINLISTKITSTISLEKSNLLDRVIIQRGINKDLDDAYETYDNIEDLLVMETKRFAKTFQSSKTVSTHYTFRN